MTRTSRGSFAKSAHGSSEAGADRCFARRNGCRGLETWQLARGGEACVPLGGMGASGREGRQLAYRNTTSRWGSCQPATGRICINVRLALYPPECLEYVVVHELCHLLERGHGPRFKELMDAFMPDWRERRAKLR
ncbi:MAG: M48 family metallopeptidase [Eggerthellaceae bacterium]